MTSIGVVLDWFRSRRDLLCELRAARLRADQAYAALVVAHREVGMWQELARCSHPSEHRRLANRLHQAEVELAVERGEDPHKASLG